MACRGFNFLPQDAAARLLGAPWNITEVSQILSPLIPSQEPTYKKALNLLQFTYTGDRSSAYVAPGSTDVTFQNLAKGEPLFALAFQRL